VQRVSGIVAYTHFKLQEQKVEKLQLLKMEMVEVVANGIPSSGPSRETTSLTSVSAQE